MITFKNASDKHITATTGTAWKGGYIVLDALPGYFAGTDKITLDDARELARLVRRRGFTVKEKAGEGVDFSIDFTISEAKP